jgi:hypothetical protein
MQNPLKRRAIIIWIKQLSIPTPPCLYSALLNSPHSPHLHRPSRRLLLLHLPLPIAIPLYFLIPPLKIPLLSHLGRGALEPQLLGALQVVRRLGVRARGRVGTAAFLGRRAVVPHEGAQAGEADC